MAGQPWCCGFCSMLWFGGLNTQHSSQSKADYWTTGDLFSRIGMVGVPVFTMVERLLMIVKIHGLPIQAFQELKGWDRGTVFVICTPRMEDWIPKLRVLTLTGLRCINIASMPPSALPISSLTGGGKNLQLWSLCYWQRSDSATIGVWAAHEKRHGIGFVP